MTQSRWRSAVLLSVLLLAFGCASSGVGDPCLPENIPGEGFVASESFLETNSVQCRTRTCIVYGLEGDPRFTAEICDPANPNRPDTECDRVGVVHPPEAEVAERLHCTCRCRAPEGSSTPTCKCPGGFECVDILNTGGPGIAGGYCVREEAL